jgi:hypothetical protein
MSDINLNNYPQWQQRYFNGELTPDEEVLFEQFLLEHPKLMDDELENGEKFVAPTVAYQGKEQLKKEPSPISGMAMFDYLAIKEYETGLDGAENQQLRAYIDRNPLLAHDVDVYGKAKLQPDSGIVFAQKASLKRQSLAGLFLVRTLKYSSVAAAVAALFYFGWPASNVVSTGEQIAVVQVEPKDDAAQTKDDPATKPEKPKVDSISTPKIRQSKKLPTPVTEIPALEPGERLLASMPSKSAIDAIHQPYVNAYEEGLNTMMPQYLDNQIEINKLLALWAPDPMAEMQKAYLPVKMVEGGVRFFNVLGLRKMSVDKYFDGDGNLVAYKVKGESVEWSRKVKQP